MAKPRIPKSLAARIRRAQEAIKDKRRAIVYGEREEVKLLELQSDLYSQLLASDLSETAYNAKVAYLQDRLDRHIKRGPERRAELAELMQQLEVTEAEMLHRVLVMKPSKGRVPWPRPLPPFEKTTEAYVRQLDAEDQRHAATAARQRELADEAAERGRAALVRDLTKLAELLANAVKRGEMTTDDALGLIRRVGTGQ